MNDRYRQAFGLALWPLMVLGLAACENTGGFSPSGDQVYAPGVDLRAEKRGKGADAAEVGHRLLVAGQYELALDAFTRAALDRGTLDTELLSGMGTANLGMGRLGQAEGLLRRAIARDDAEPVDYNNLAVVLMERGETSEAIQYFKRAFALSNGDNTEIRDNLRLALAKSEKSATTEEQDSSEFKLVRRGRSQFVIQSTP